MAGIVVVNSKGCDYINLVVDLDAKLIGSSVIIWRCLKTFLAVEFGPPYVRFNFCRRDQTQLQVVVILLY